MTEGAIPVLAIGELLVEVMADTPGDGFREPMALTGPFPSGAPAIFIDQIARLGRPAAIAGGVGRDDFGALLTGRLAADGVATGAVAEIAERATGTAFVRYRPDGARAFVFHLAQSAAGQLAEGPALQGAVAAAGHLHVMGSSLTVPALAALNERAAAEITGRGGTLSLDPNLRPELLTPESGAALGRLAALADLYLPGEAELDRPPGALLAAGMAAVVVKRGAAGAVLHTREGRIEAPGLATGAVDPTGAGDCFDAAFVDAWLAGRPPEEALARANAAGALAATVRGPMEGAGRAAADIARRLGR